MTADPSTPRDIATVEHLRHMTDGRWHDDCRYCLQRRVFDVRLKAAADRATSKPHE